MIVPVAVRLTHPTPGPAGHLNHRAPAWLRRRAARVAPGAGRAGGPHHLGRRVLCANRGVRLRVRAVPCLLPRPPAGHARTAALRALAAGAQGGHARHPRPGRPTHQQCRICCRRRHAAPAQPARAALAPPRGALRDVLLPEPRLRVLLRRLHREPLRRRHLCCDAGARVARLQGLPAGGGRLRRHALQRGAERRILGAPLPAALCQGGARWAAVAGCRGAGVDGGRRHGGGGPAGAVPVVRLPELLRRWRRPGRGAAVVRRHCAVPVRLRAEALLGRRLSDLLPAPADPQLCAGAAHPGMVCQRHLGLRPRQLARRAGTRADTRRPHWRRAHTRPLAASPVLRPPRYRVRDPLGSAHRRCRLCHARPGGHPLPVRQPAALLVRRPPVGAAPRPARPPRALPTLHRRWRRAAPDLPPMDVSAALPRPTAHRPAIACHIRFHIDWGTNLCRALSRVRGSKPSCAVPNSWPSPIALRQFQLDHGIATTSTKGEKYPAVSVGRSACVLVTGPATK
mmetsp:Transcript_47169/g.118122  ORF Transcript_47169/g.118122 Transcript_47169/m.118122 type:complete len:512 (-) Transcript_47169:111-1646(-)